MIESTIKVGDWVQVTKTNYFGIKPLLLSHPRKVTAVRFFSLNDIIAVEVPGKTPIFPEGWWLNKRCGNDWHKVPAPKEGD
jgi:hypothetical protein